MWVDDGDYKNAVTPVMVTSEHLQSHKERYRETETGHSSF